MNPLLVKREIWRSIEGYPRYLVSNKGRVKKKSVLVGGRFKGYYVRRPSIMLTIKQIEGVYFKQISLWKGNNSRKKGQCKETVSTINLVFAAFGDPDIHERDSICKHIYHGIFKNEDRAGPAKYSGKLNGQKEHKLIYLPYFKYAYQAAIFRDRYIRAHGYSDIKNFRDDDKSNIGRLSRTPLSTGDIL